MKERERKKAAKLEKKRKLAKKNEKLVAELPIPKNLNRLNSGTYNWDRSSSKEISASGIDASIAALSCFERVKEETGE
ncbi:UNVERIFIED_CONTAM: hypothetical protein RMT77_012169 [Armadillidium vulgare]